MDQNAMHPPAMSTMDGNFNDMERNIDTCHNGTINSWKNISMPRESVSYCRLDGDCARLLFGGLESDSASAMDLCEPMLNVVRGLFDGGMDYDD